MTMIDHQVPLKYKENIHRNFTLKLRRCVALFLHLIGINQTFPFKTNLFFVFFIDNSSISDFLQHDKHFRHADKVKILYIRF
jgi:hypothetical protein